MNIHLNITRSIIIIIIIMKQELQLCQNGMMEPLGLSNERVNYCRNLNYDVLELSELHNTQNKKSWKGRRWITCKDCETGRYLNSNAITSIGTEKNFERKWEQFK